MPTKCPVACTTCGKGDCQEHKTVAKAQPYVGNQPLYHTGRWTKFRKTLLACNPQCQHVFDDGKRCMQPSSVGHHLIDMKDGGALTDPANVVAVCAGCHQGGQRGETQGYAYAPTKWIFGAVYEHNGPQVLKSGSLTRLTGGIVRT